MKHSIGYPGRYERSFADLRPGIREYVREDGSVGHGRASRSAGASGGQGMGSDRQ